MMCHLTPRLMISPLTFCVTTGLQNSCFLNVTNLPRVMNASSPKIRTAGGAPWKIGIKNLSLSVFISIFPIISFCSSIGGGSIDDLPSISGQID